MLTAQSLSARVAFGGLLGPGPQSRCSARGGVLTSGQTLGPVLQPQGLRRGRQSQRAAASQAQDAQLVPAGELDPHIARLHGAVDAGDVAGLQQALNELQDPEQDIDVLVQRAGGVAQAAIHRAAAAGQELCLKVLLLHGADRDLADAAGRTALYCAAEAGQEECLAVLLSGGVSRTAADAAGRAPLQAAAAGGWERCLWQLINERVPVDARDNDGSTALHLAAARGSTACLRALLSAGASPLAVDSRRGRTPRQRASAEGHAAAEQYLLAVESTARAFPGSRPTRAELLSDQGELAAVYRLARQLEAAQPGSEAALQAEDALRREVGELVERQGQGPYFAPQPNHV